MSACEQSLKLLQVDEIDLYLIHNPFAKENRLEQWGSDDRVKKTRQSKECRCIKL
jgi:2,5-diketo-D-gluconate reductase A